MTDQTVKAPETEPSAYFKLSRRRQHFVDLYVELGVGAEAYRRIWAKAKRPDNAAYKLLRLPQIAQAVQERIDRAIHEAGVNQFRTIQELARVAFFDMRRIYAEDGTILPINKLPADIAAGLAAIEIEDLFEGRGEARECVGTLHKYKAWSKVDALKLLMEFQKLIVNRHEVGGPGGAPLSPPIINIGFENGGPGQPAAGAESP